MKRSLLALALVAIAPFAAQADDNLSYTYVEADYLNIDGDADGFGLRGSVEFGESNFYGFGGYSNSDIDNTSIDVDMYDLGIGYAHGVSPNADLIAELAYINADADGFDVDGYRTSVGVRGSFSPNFEGLLKANYIDGSDFDGDFSATVGAQYKFAGMWGIVGEAEFGNGAESYLIGVRASF
jgi:Ax21 family sulfation-dependent quorum factor